MYEQREKPKEKVKANNRPDTRSVVTNRVRHFHDRDDIRGDFLGRPANGLLQRNKSDKASDLQAIAEAKRLQALANERDTLAWQQPEPGLGTVSILGILPTRVMLSGLKGTMKNTSNMLGKDGAPKSGHTVTALNRSDLEQQIISRLAQDVKGNPLRQEYETKVAELARYQQGLTHHSIGDKAIANMANLPGSEKALAEAANNARRQLGVEYKNLTPEPLRDYIYEVNLRRYGDPLGPTVDFLVQQGKTYSQIVESAARPNPDVNMLLNGFAKWLTKQPDDYVQKYMHLLNGGN